MLEAHSLSIRLGGKPIVRDISIHLQAGEVVGLIGPNGSGKSTLLRTLAGLLPVAEGTVSLQGRPLDGIPLRELARTLAYLPQSPECHWPLTVERVVALGRLPFGGFGGQNSEEADETHVRRALASVDALGLRERVLDTLSGGERARVFLARALAGDPALLLIDEPTAGLDPFHQLALMELLAARAREGRGVLVVLHDLGLAARFCHRLILLKEGRLLASGTPEAVLSDSRVAEAHGVTVYRGTHQEEPVLVPWSCL